jgi:dTDP-D-glucose 4,6-dehydratase
LQNGRNQQGVGLMNTYKVTIRYITPSGKQSEAVDIWGAESPFAATQQAKDWIVRYHPTRKVKQFISASCELYGID